jgi:hypothetical protein
VFEVALFPGLTFWCIHASPQALLRHELGQSILRNILPTPIADQLMRELAVSSRIRIAHTYRTATVCFCDIVGVPHRAA